MTGVRRDCVVTYLPGGATAATGRTRTQRLSLAAPQVARRLRQAVWLLPPASPIRRAGVRQQVQEAYGAFNRRDWESVVSVLAPDAERRFWPERAGAGPGAFLDLDLHVRGRVAVQRFFEGWLEAWGDFQVTPRKICDFGDCVLVATRVEARGRGSEAVTGRSGADVFRLEDGWCTRWDTYATEARALEAVGAQEEPARSNQR